MIDGTPWGVTDKGVDAVDAAVIVDKNGGEVLGVSQWARIDDKPLADIVRAVNAHDALVAALIEARQAIPQDDYFNVKPKVDAALALARKGGE